MTTKNMVATNHEIKYPIVDYVEREDGPEILFMQLRKNGEQLRVDNFDTGNVPTRETVAELDKLLCAKVTARLHIIASHIAAIMMSPPEDTFTLSPCDGVHVKVRYERSIPQKSMTEHDQRVWDQVYLNEKLCGNRYGAAKQYINIIATFDPRIVLDIVGEQYQVPAVS